MNWLQTIEFDFVMYFLVISTVNNSKVLSRQNFSINRCTIISSTVSQIKSRMLLYPYVHFILSMLFEDPIFRNAKILIANY